MIFCSIIYCIITAFTSYLLHNYCKNIAMISKEHLKTLKSRAPRGYFKRILEKVDVSERTVSNFLIGRNYREDIHLAMLEVIEEHEMCTQHIREREAEVLKTKRV